MSASSPSKCSSARADGGGESLVVNELAPRVHNSGHWTIDGAQTSQFEQHMRAIAGWPLGGAARRGRIEMRNLIGDEAGRMAGDSRRARPLSASLRQGGGPPRPQDGPRDADLEGKGGEGHRRIELKRSWSAANQPRPTEAASIAPAPRSNSAALNSSSTSRRAMSRKYPTRSSSSHLASARQYQELAEQRSQAAAGFLIDDGMYHWTAPLQQSADRTGSRTSSRANAAPRHWRRRRRSQSGRHSPRRIRRRDAGSETWASEGGRPTKIRNERRRRMTSASHAGTQENPTVPTFAERSPGQLGDVSTYRKKGRSQWQNYCGKSKQVQLTATATIQFRRS